MYEAALCIDAFYHSEEGSRVDNESKRIYKIKDPATTSNTKLSVTNYV
jgi:hypothetical protein